LLGLFVYLLVCLFVCFGCLFASVGEEEEKYKSTESIRPSTQ